MASENPIDNDQAAAHRENEAEDHAEKKTYPEKSEITCNVKRDWIDKLTLGLEGLGFLALVVYAVFTIKIWRANKTAADAAQTAAHAAQNAATAARDTADVARQTMHIDQRAWIGVVVGQGAMNNQQPIRMPIRLTNTGKTPALKVQGTIVVNLLRRDEEPDFSYVTGHPRYGIEGHTVLPNLPQDLAFAVLPKDADPTAPLNPILVTDAIRQGMENGALYTVVHGEITYEDIFGIAHWIKFCNYAHNIVGFPQISVANTCGAYNDVDKNN
jgi:hypothetical protein